MRTPSNPRYWWGNALHFDQPPAAGDFARWTTLFRGLIHARQPVSKHMTFAWTNGADAAIPRDVESFVAAGFTYFESLSLALDRARRQSRRTARVCRRSNALATTTAGVAAPAGDDARRGAGRGGLRRVHRRLHRRMAKARAREAGRLALHSQRRPDRRRARRIRRSAARAGRAATRTIPAGGDRSGVSTLRARRDSRRARIARRIRPLRRGSAADLGGRRAAPRRVYESCGYRIAARHGGLELPDPA